MQRSDLVLEVTGTLDANGSFVSDWVDTGGVHSVRVAGTPGGWQLEQSTDTANILGPVNGTGGLSGIQATTDVSQFYIAARYFRVRVDAGAQYYANRPFAVSVRAVS